MNIDEIIALDKADPLAKKCLEFDLPVDTLYLDGNSLGACLNRLNREWQRWLASNGETT